MTMTLTYHIPRRRALLTLASVAALAALVGGCVATPAATQAPAATQTSPTAAQAQAAPATQAAATKAPTTKAPAAAAATGQPSVDLEKLPTGVDADGNFYRGDAKASVRLQDFSDFQ